MCNTRVSQGVTPGEDRASSLKWEEALLSRQGMCVREVTQSQSGCGWSMNVSTGQMKDFSKRGQSNII